MSCFSAFSASALEIISLVTRAEKDICAKAKAAIVEPAAWSGLVKSSSSSDIQQLSLLTTKQMILVLGKNAPANWGQEAICMSIHTQHFHQNNAADRELQASWRAVASAKLTSFRKECWRLALLAQKGDVPKQDAVDQLWTIATAHALVRSMGEDHVQAIISEPFAAVDRESA
jgi:hypothetical protein